MPKEICPTTGIKGAQRLQKMPKEICPRIDTKASPTDMPVKSTPGRNPNQLAKNQRQRPKGWTSHWRALLEY
ncbi:UNVERIFIED_CONTAM: hypothetical protein Sradi_6348900 [Sesamum radiatum]|uniref:Uncharacterized protein n=1 Tax=Sesamum radiatum TaxID=300843 RepID=A0AAW2K212_SESRA